MTVYEGDTRKYRRFKDGKFKVKCLSEYTDEIGRRFLCNFNQREDRFKENLKKNKLHKCKFVLVNESTIDNFFEKEVSTENESISIEDLITQLIVFIGKRNLSLECGASDDLYKLLTYCIAFGITLANKKFNNPLKEAQNNFPKISQEKIRKKMIEIADLLHRTIMKKYSALPYVSVAIDEGTTKTKNLDFVLHNVMSDIPPYPCVVRIMDGGKATNYVKSLNEGLDEITKYSISIASVVTDGNSAQEKALSIRWDKSLYNNTNDEWKKKILIIPCICHRIQNAYKNGIKKDKRIQNCVAHLHNISDVLCSNADEIGGICPRHIDTRWLYDYNIYDYIEKHETKIRKYVGSITPDLRNLGQILVILRSLINIFEAPSTKLSTVYYYIERAHLAFKQILTNNPFADIFDSSLMNYTLDSKDGGIWVFAYLITPNGRDDFYGRIKKSKFFINLRRFLKLF